MLLVTKDFFFARRSESASIDWLPSNRYSVVERAHPRRLEASMDVNHGGVAIIALACVCLTAVNVDFIPSMFEYVAVVARVTTGQSPCLVVVVYCPGSSAVTASFSIELADVLECSSTLVDPIVFASDINIRLDRVWDANTVAFRDHITSYGLTQLVNDITHDNGGTLDVCVRVDQSIPLVDVIDIGPSDLLHGDPSAMERSVQISRRLYHVINGTGVMMMVITS